MINRIFFAVIICSLLFVGCEVDRLPLNGPTTDTFPASEKEAESGLFAAYKGLTLLTASSMQIVHVMDNSTDIGYIRPGNNYTPLITSSITTTNTWANKPWTYYYKTIARCHLVLDNLPNLKAEMSVDRYNQIDAELRVIRAYCYSQLIELYGDVPLVQHSLTLENSKVPRTPKADIQQWIVDELEAVEDSLPASQSAYGTIRVGSVAAYMLKARVLLYSERYAEAATAANKAMTLAAGVFDLTDFNASKQYCNKTYAEGEPNCSNIFGYDGYKSSKEWIWTISYSQLISENTHNQGYYMGSRLAKGCAYTGPTQNFIDSFQCLDGKFITESELYDASKPFTNRDLRLDMYCVRPGSRLFGIQFEPNSSFKKVSNYWPVLNGESETPSSVTNTDATNSARSYSGYLWRKHTDIKDYETNSSKGVSDLNVGIFRYAELLLIYAEAKIEANDIDESVYTALERTRSRAGLPLLSRGMSQEQLRTVLRYERKVELCNDGMRWYDLRRWKIAPQVMNGVLYLNRSAKTWKKDALTSIDVNANPVYAATATSYFNTQSVVFDTENNKDYYWPIPQSERDANPDLTQNGGY